MDDRRWPWRSIARVSKGICAGERPEESCPACPKRGPEPRASALGPAIPSPALHRAPYTPNVRGADRCRAASIAPYCNAINASAMRRCASAPRSGPVGVPCHCGAALRTPVDTTRKAPPDDQRDSHHLVRVHALPRSLLPHATPVDDDMPRKSRRGRPEHRYVSRTQFPSGREVSWINVPVGNSTTAAAIPLLSLRRADRRSHRRKYTLCSIHG